MVLLGFLRKIRYKAFKIDLPPFLGIYQVINAEYKLFEPHLHDENGDAKVIFEYLWFGRDEPLKQDCILERKLTNTREE